MDPERVRAYLQVACAGLGFDIGEIWWTSNHESTIGTRKSHCCVVLFLVCDLDRIIMDYDIFVVF
jgi:hypothetical protein